LSTRWARAITYAVVAVLAFAALHMTPPIARKPAELLGASASGASASGGLASAPLSSSADSAAPGRTPTLTIDTLGPGETLSQVLTRGGLDGSDAAEAVRAASAAKTLDERKVPAGVQVTVTQAPGD
jgi:hypothetical protein